jgi:hypothetical protein
MRTMKTMLPIAVLAALCAGGLGAGTHAATAKKAKPRPALRDSTIWTATTYEAASKDVNKAVLAAGRPVTITGEVVDVSCYLQLGKRGAAHVECGSKCVANGQPLGIVDKDDNLYVLFPEEHHPRRDGDVDIKSKFVLLMAKNVKVQGTLSKMHGTNALFLKSDAFPDTLPAR